MPIYTLYSLTFAVPFTTQAGMVARCDWNSIVCFSTGDYFLGS
jgi:hypothetical protein